MLSLPSHPALDSPEEIDAQYNNRALVPEHPQLYEQWQPLCAQVLADFTCHQDVAYGASQRERMDIVLPNSAGPHPVLLYIHGGYWMSRSKSDQTFLARAYAEAGIAFVLVEYDLIPSVGMNDVVYQCRAATAWLHAHADEYGLDTERFFVSGHSAGGHLTAMLADTDWATFCDGPADLIKGGVAISGIYDLTPIRHSYMQETLALSEADVATNSPQFFKTAPRVPLIVAPGGAESDAFRHQSRNLVNTWNAVNGNCSYLEVPGCNHFTILSEFSDPESQLAKATMEMIHGT